MLHKANQISFRPSFRPGIQSPLTVRSAGHYYSTASSVSNPPREFTQLFWVEKGEILVKLRSKTFICGAGNVFYYRANEAHCIHFNTDDAEYYWVTFDGAFVGEWLKSAEIDQQARHLGWCPVNLFELIRCNLENAGIRSELDNAELGLRLLMTFCGNQAIVHEVASEKDEPSVFRIEELIKNQFRKPDFGIETISAQVARHRTTVFRQFIESRGISPSGYLQRLRLQEGLRLLTESNLPIGEVALKCGFRDSNYFTKIVKKATGDSPRKLRQKGSFF